MSFNNRIVIVGTLIVLAGVLGLWYILQKPSEPWDRASHGTPADSSGARRILCRDDTLSTLHASLQQAVHQLQSKSDSLRSCRQNLARLHALPQGDQPNVETASTGRCDSLWRVCTLLSDSLAAKKKDFGACLAELQQAHETVMLLRNRIAILEEPHTFRMLFVLDNYLHQSETGRNENPLRQTVIAMFDTLGAHQGWQERYCDIHPLVFAAEKRDVFQGVRRAAERDGLSVESLYFLALSEQWSPTLVSRDELLAKAREVLCRFERDFTRIPYVLQTLVSRDLLADFVYARYACGPLASEKK